MDRIYSYIDEHSQRFIDELATFVKQPSISSQGIGIEDCAKLLTQMMEDVGIGYEVMPMGGDTNPPLIYGELSSPGASKTLQKRFLSTVITTFSRPNPSRPGIPLHLSPPYATAGCTGAAPPTTKHRCLPTSRRWKPSLKPAARRP